MKTSILRLYRSGAFNPTNGATYYCTILSMSVLHQLPYLKSRNVWIANNLACYFLGNEQREMHPPEPNLILAWLIQ